MKDFEILQVKYNNSALGIPGVTIRYLVDGERGTAYCLHITYKGDLIISTRNGEVRASIPAKDLLTRLRKPLHEHSGEHLCKIHDILGEAEYPVWFPRTLTNIVQSIRGLMYHRNFFRSDNIQLRDIIAELKKNEQKANTLRDEELALIDKVLDDAGYCGDGRESVAKGIEALAQIRRNLQSRIDGVKRALLCAGFADTGEHASQIHDLRRQRDMFKDECTTTQGRYNVELDRLREIMRRQADTIIDLRDGKKAPRKRPFNTVDDATTGKTYRIKVEEVPDELVRCFECVHMTARRQRPAKNGDFGYCSAISGRLVSMHVFRKRRCSKFLMRTKD